MSGNGAFSISEKNIRAVKSEEISVHYRFSTGIVKVYKNSKDLHCKDNGKNAK